MIYVLDSPVLLSLHSQFLSMIREIPIKAISFAETQPTIISPLLLQLEFVPINSAGKQDIFKSRKKIHV